MEKKLLLLDYLRHADIHGYQRNEMLAERAAASIVLSRANAYKLLKQMERDGWVTSREERAGNWPTRRVYSVTPAGEEAPVLEIGIGTGRIAWPLVDAGARVAGIDLSLEMLREVREGKPASSRLDILQGDMHELPFADNAFGTVLAVHVLHLARDWRQTMTEIARVPRSGGAFVQGDDWMDPNSVIGRLRDELRRLAMAHSPGLKPPSAGIDKAQLLRDLGGGEVVEQVVAEWHFELWSSRMAVFDFSCVAQQIQGYCWDFPCLVDGVPTMNRGILASRVVPGVNGSRSHGLLKQAFDSSLAARRVDLGSVPLEGHPARWFNVDAAFAQPRVLFVGDAAGVDPLFAEGISYALEYGDVAARSIELAFAGGDFSFAAYRGRLLDHSMGRMLRRRVALARSLYGYRRPRQWALLWRLAAISPTLLQRLFAAGLGLLPI